MFTPSKSSQFDDEQDDRYRPFNRRQRLKIIALVVAVVVALWMMLLMRPGAHVRQFPTPTAQKPCAAGQTQGCVGGLATVTLMPAAGAASAASR